MCTLETHETILPTPQVFTRVEVWAGASEGGGKAGGGQGPPITKNCELCSVVSTPHKSPSSAMRSSLICPDSPLILPPSSTVEREPRERHLR